MEVIAVVLVFISGLLQTTAGVSHGDCSVWEMADCWVPMYQHLDDLDTSIVPTYTDEELTPICNSYDEVQRCVQDFIAACHPSVQTDFKSVNDSWHYICVETKAEYLQHRDCLDNEQLHSEGELVCYNDFTDHMARLRDSGRDLTYLFERQCHYVNNYLDCVENLIKSFADCDEAAALWQRELDRRTLQPLLTNTGCQLDNSTGKIVYVYRNTSGSDDQQGETSRQHSPISKSVLIGCTVALGLIVLAVGLLIVFKCLSNKKEQNSRYANQPAPQRGQWAAPAQAYGGRAVAPVPAYGYGGGAVAFGVFDDSLPGKEEQNLNTDNPPEYSAQPHDSRPYTTADSTDAIPPSQPPPYTGYPRNHTTRIHAGPTAPNNSMTDIE